MLASAVVYAGLVIALVGLSCLVKPMRSLRVPTRGRALVMATTGVVAVGIAMTLPATESRTSGAATRLDEFSPVWQFSEFHTIRIAAPPARVYDAVKRVRVDEIFLFRTLMAIRRGGAPVPENLRNPEGRSLLDLATHTTFVWLADEFPHELVVGTVVGAPPGPREALTAELFRKPVPPGFALATMNFVVTPDGEDGSVVSTETRVTAGDLRARRRFAVYWRVIYPGSALIRRMWLRAIERRSLAGRLSSRSTPSSTSRGTSYSQVDMMCGRIAADRKEQ